MDPATLAAVRQNLIPSAHPAIKDWDAFPWHRSGGVVDTMRSHSSQALAIDVFGTLKASTPAVIDQIVGELASTIGLSGAGPWDVALEWNDRENRLKETGTRSQIDVALTSPHALICIEAKFTEPDGGCCSQPQPIGSGPNQSKRQCNGNYELQTNPVNGKTARCALAAKGIRYWEVAEQAMHVNGSVDSHPCPFAGPTYQWMRNLCLAYESARAREKAAGVLVVYADALHLPMAQKVNSVQWATLRNQVRTDRIAFAAMSYQQIVGRTVQVLGEHTAEAKPWAELRDWVARKVESTIRS